MKRKLVLSILLPFVTLILSSCQVNSLISRLSQPTPESSVDTSQPSSFPSSYSTFSSDDSNHPSSIDLNEELTDEEAERILREEFQGKIDNDGATVFYLRVAPDSVPLPAYCSYYLTGVFCDWAERQNDGALELLRYDSRGLYAVHIYGYDDSLHAEHRGYQVTMGYNYASGLPAENAGINWSYKAESNDTYPGLECPIYDAPDRGLVHLKATFFDGYTEEAGFRWNRTLPDPSAQPGDLSVKNFRLVFRLCDPFSSALAEWNAKSGQTGVIGFAIKGDFTNWEWRLIEDWGEGAYYFDPGSVFRNVTYQFVVAPYAEEGVYDDRYDLIGDGPRMSDSVEPDGRFHLGNLYFCLGEGYLDDCALFWGYLDMPGTANGSYGDLYSLPSAQPKDDSYMIVTDLGFRSESDQLYLCVYGVFSGVMPINFMQRVYCDLMKYGTWEVVDCYSAASGSASMSASMSDPQAKAGAFTININITNKLTAGDFYYIHFDYSSIGDPAHDGCDVHWNAEKMVAQRASDPINHGTAILGPNNDFQDVDWARELAILTFLPAA